MQAPTIRDILVATSCVFGIKISDLTGPNRIRKIARPRQLAMYMARELTDCSYPFIGEIFGGRDHTTVMFSYRASAKRIAENSEWAEYALQVREAVPAATCYRLEKIAAASVGIGVRACLGPKIATERAVA